MKNRLAVILMPLLLTLPLAQAHAAGNVLLPPENQDKSSLPNLGLMPAEQPAAPAEPLKPEPVKQTPPPDTTTPAPTPPAQQVQQLPTPVFQQPAPPRRAMITVALSSQTAWTPNDIATVSSQLGIPRVGVTSLCRMGINGTLMSDRGATAVESNGALSTNVVYEGFVNNAVLNVYAACTVAPKPAAFSPVQKVGSLYVMPLNSAFCQPKVPFNGTMRQITITHATTAGSDSCAYTP